MKLENIISSNKEIENIYYTIAIKLYPQLQKFTKPFRVVKHYQYSIYSKRIGKSKTKSS